MPNSYTCSSIEDANLNMEKNVLVCTRDEIGNTQTLIIKGITVQLTADPLKGQCHEDFAVLDQFWAKIITLRLYSLTKCFCKVATKISNEFYQRGLTIIKFLRIF